MLGQTALLCRRWELWESRWVQLVSEMEVPFNELLSAQPFPRQLPFAPKTHITDTQINDQIHRFSLSLFFFFFCFSSSTWTQRFLFPGVRAVCSATAPHEPGAPASPYRLSLARHPKRSRAWCCAPAGGHRRAGGRRRGSRRPLDAFSGHETYSAEGFLHVGSLGNNL